MVFMIDLSYLTKPDFLPPAVQSHRGFWSSEIAENTFEAIMNSYNHGFKMTEFDVRITADDVVILFHDHKLEDDHIHKLAYSDLLKKQKISTLDSVLKWVSDINDQKSPQEKFYLNIEIKSKKVINRKLENAVIALILKYQVSESVLISSFNPLSLYYFKRYAPKIPRALLLTFDNDHGNNFLIKSQILNILARPHFLHLHEKYWNKMRFARLLKRKIPIVLWTCNDLEQAKKYLADGIYGIISDKITPKDLN